MKKIICFHNPDEINGYLSNWYLSDFEIGGMKYFKALGRSVKKYDDILAECAVQDRIWGIVYFLPIGIAETI